MDLQRAETLLRKINMLFESLQADEEVSAIERDLMREHLRRLYDEFTRPATSPPKSPTGGRRAPRAAAPPQVEVIKKTAAPRPTPPPAPAVPEPTPEPPYAPPRLIELDEDLRALAEQPAPPPSPKPRPRPAAKPKPREAAPAAGAPLREEVEALFDLPKSADVAGRLGNSRIGDLNRAMGLNERFLTRDELFGGDEGAMKDTLQVLNGFDSFGQAKQWLAANVIDKYDWTEKNRRKKAQVFLKLVRRRYV